MYGSTLGSFILSHKEIEKAYEKRGRELRKRITENFCELDDKMLLEIKKGNAFFISLTDERAWESFLRVVGSANGFGEKITVKQVMADDLVKPGMLYVSTKKPDIDWEVLYHDFYLSSMDNLLVTRKVSMRNIHDHNVYKNAAVAAAAVAI